MVLLLRSLPIVIVALALTLPTSWAAPIIAPVTADPATVQVNVPTQIRVTAEIHDSSLVGSSVNLQRRSADGRWTVLGSLHDDGLNGDEAAGDGVFAILIGLNESQSGKVHLRVSAAFRGLLKRVFSDEFEVASGVLLSAGDGATVTGPGGTSITVQPDSVSYEVLVGITPIAQSNIIAPLGALPLTSAVEVIFEPINFSAHHPPPSRPLEISVPAPSGMAEGTPFIVAQQAVVDAFTDTNPGLREQLLPVDTASVIGGRIVSEAAVFSGILGGGQFAIVEETGSGFATGVVSDGSGPRPGVVVSNSTNTLVAVTNGAGQYTLFISGGPFTVTGFDPFKGSSGSSGGNIVVDGSTVAADIALTPLSAPPITRDGIRNGGFERGDLTSWGCSGSCNVLQQFGPTSGGVSINPTEGQWMADINTGTNAVGDVGSSLTQRFIVPAGVRALRLDFNFVSEEFPEFVGSIFDDSFRAVITTPSGETTFAQVSVNASGGFTLIGDCFFPGGDLTCGQTGWREGSVDLSAWSGTATPITVQLLFSANDAGDNIYDTHILVDNIRFGTVWVDTKIIQGATANQARVQSEVLGAAEILSQAGLNVRLRNNQTIADPGSLLDTDITWAVECRPLFLCFLGLGTTKGVPTVEEIQLMGLSRSTTATDVNVYYVRSMPPGGACALAFGPDDFHDVGILSNAGTIHANISAGCAAGGHILAHELGHLLVSPERAGDVLEHSAGATNFLGGTGVAPLLGIVNRQQSANINRVGAPLVTP